MKNTVGWKGTPVGPCADDCLNLYRSSDEGKTLLNFVTSLKAFGSNQPAKTPKVKKLVVSPVDPSCVFVVGKGVNHWVTRDAGRSFEPVNSVVKFHDVVMHPTDSKRVLASSMAPKCHDAEANGLCYKSVYATQDFGKTWIKATDYVVQFDWAHNLGNARPKTCLQRPCSQQFSAIRAETNGLGIGTKISTLSGQTISSKRNRKSLWSTVTDSCLRRNFCSSHK